MSNLSYLQEQIAATVGQLQQLDKSIVEYPEELTLSISSISLQKRLSKLQVQFEEEASQVGYSVCNYRLLTSEANPSMAVIGEALTTFQSLVSVVYAALKDKTQKNSLKIATEHKQASSLGWAFSYPGSVGVVLTIKKEQNLFDDETPLDDAIKTALQLTEVNDPQEMAEHARNLGAGPIRAVFKWSDCLAKNQMGTEIEWKRNLENTTSKTVDLPIFKRLRDIISEMSDTVKENFIATGMLEAINHQRNTFTIETSDGEFIAGAISDELNDQGWTTKLEYKASIESTSVINYSTEATKVSYKLIGLELIQ